MIDRSTLRVFGLLACFLAVSLAPGSVSIASDAVGTDGGRAAVRTAGTRSASVASIGIIVSDLDRAVAFYTGVLGFQTVETVELSSPSFERLNGVFGSHARRATLRLGDERIVLTQFLAPEGRPMPADSRSNDRWFQHIAIVVADMERAYAHLRAHNVRHASSGPQTLPLSIPEAAGISAFYFKDPDGHVLEIIHFPEGKGDPRWQTPSDRMFLGIDHTAIVVADTDASVLFYQRVLGLRVAGTSENFGTEQEHLNNVFGARLRITGLRGDSGPGVELLEYLAPTDGRPMPPDSRANDLWSWQTLFSTTEIESVSTAAREARARWISPVVLDDSSKSASLAVRDPDGHALFVEQSGVAKTAQDP